MNLAADEPTLESALRAVANDLGVAAATAGSQTSWSVGGRTFASLTAGVAEFRLDGPIAAAARRTPDTAPSERGPDWVRFAPPTLDAMALDRAVAWFEAACRRAR